MFMNQQCKSIGCNTQLPKGGPDFCITCREGFRLPRDPQSEESVDAMAEKYPDQFQPVGEAKELDVFAVHHMFRMNDPSGCLHHCSRLLLMSGAQPDPDDIEQARDALTRWLELNAPSTYL